MDREQFFNEWSELHGGANVTGFTRGWLGFSYIVVKPLSKVGVTPNSISYLGLLLGVFTWFSSRSYWAPLFLMFSLIADGIDGSLAITSESVTRWGAILDSVIDRIVEFFWALAFIQIGAPKIIIGIAWVAALTQEYLRARTAGVGYRTIRVITIAERPVRAIFLAIGFLNYFSHLRLIALVAGIWMVAQVISLVMVFRDSYSALSSNN